MPKGRGLIARGLLRSPCLPITLAAMPITRRRWTAREHRMIRTLPPKEAARKLGRTIVAVRDRRSALEVAHLRRPWTPAEDRLLVTLPEALAVAYLGRAPGPPPQARTGGKPRILSRPAALVFPSLAV